MKSILIILIFSLIQLSYAEDTDNFDDTRDLISSKYLTGGHLLYDCEDQHWVCVIKENKEACDAKRQKEISLGKHHLTCFSAEFFQTYKECSQKQKELTKSGMNPRVCLHPSVRGRLIGFQ